MTKEEMIEEMLKPLEGKVIVEFQKNKVLSRYRYRVIFNFVEAGTKWITEATFEEYAFFENTELEQNIKIYLLRKMIKNKEVSKMLFDLGIYWEY